MKKFLLFFTTLFTLLSLQTHTHAALTLKKIIKGKITPKSIVHSGHGLFFAQNMFYRHSITVYNRKFQLVKTIKDTITLPTLGHPNYTGKHRGSPVEAAFSHQGRFAWISNYKTFGRGFPRAARDRCRPTKNQDNSFVYRIDTRSLKIVNAILVGAVPKFLAVTPDDKRVLVTNWCSWDLSIIDTHSNKQTHRIKIGRYPRGIAIDPHGKYAYIAVMGSYHIAILDLHTLKLRWWKRIGRLPRHLNISPDGNTLYASFCGRSRVAKIDTRSGKIIKKIHTGSAPRSMILSKDGRLLFVVNYLSATISQIRTRDMAILHTIKTHPRPIGITFDDDTQHVWVACYRGSIMIFKADPSTRLTRKRRKRRKRRKKPTNSRIKARD